MRSKAWMDQKNRHNVFNKTLVRISELNVYFTEWNSSELVKSVTSKGKKKQTLTPSTFSLIHATDFADRYERHIAPLLQSGSIVLCDRYVYTAYVRDITRGCDEQWIRQVYSYAVQPDITFYFNVPLDVALHRILSNRPKLKFFEAGMDMGLSKNISESFKLFQGKIYDQYHRLLQSESFVNIDATLPIQDQQHSVRHIIETTIALNTFKKTLKNKEDA